MMELAYADMMADVRCSAIASSAAAPALLSFKVPHHLPAFDGYGDYEPQRRNHRISIEFASQSDLAKFQQQVYATMQAQVMRR